MKAKLLVLSIFLFAAKMNAQYSVYYIGHSLINLNTPFIVKELRLAAGQTCVYRNHINNGASLKAQWENPPYVNPNPIWDSILGMDVEHATDFTVSLAPGATPTIHRNIITESVPLLDNPIDTTAKYGKLFHNLAKGHSTSIKNYMMSTWEPVGTGGGAWAAWRTSINTLRPNWEQRVDAINTPSTSNNMYIVPAGLALAALYDTLQLHAIGPLTQLSQIFGDNIHMNDDGNYFVACVMYATIYLQSPEGLPAVKAGPYTGNTAINNATVRAKLQQIAWSVVQSYPRSGYQSPLAVGDLDCFSAENKSDAVEIKFCLATNAHNQDVTIEKSKNGLDFEPIAAFKNVNRGIFSHLDKDNLEGGTLYYKLLFKEKNTVGEYSKIISVEHSNQRNIISPNPAKDFLNIKLAAVENNGKMLIYNTLQQLVLQIPYQEQIDISALPSGMYIVKDGKNTCVGKFVKE